MYHLYLFQTERNMKKAWLLLSMACWCPFCSTDRQKSDAYGNFEAVEYIVSAEGQGTLTDFLPKEENYRKSWQLCRMHRPPSCF
jgi:hypothetical protein